MTWIIMQRTSRRKENLDLKNAIKSALDGRVRSSIYVADPYSAGRVAKAVWWRPCRRSCENERYPGGLPAVLTVRANAANPRNASDLPRPRLRLQPRRCGRVLQ